MKKTLLLSLAITLAACQNRQSDEVPVSLIEYFRSSSLPAAAMGYTTRDGTTRWYVFGPSIWGTTDTVSHDDIFRLFSMTKAIGSVAALQLVEKGLIRLDDPLNELMPEMVSIPILTEQNDLVTSDQVITLRHLLTHTSGFAYPNASRLRTFKPQNWQYEDNPRLFEPGTQWRYGTSTDWVGRVVEKVSGQDLETYIRKNITGPLRMNSTWFNVPDSLKKRIVSWGVRDSTGLRENPRIPTQRVTAYKAGGGLYGSPEDYLAFLRCLLNDGKYEGGQLLKPETVQMMFRNELPDKVAIEYEIPDTMSVASRRYLDESDKHGLAWAIEDNDAETVRAKGTGYWGGAANTYFTVDPSNGVAIVYFSQILPFNDKEAFGLFRLFEQEVYSMIATE